MSVNVDGNKSINLFDVNGVLLARKTFTDKSCEIHLDALRGKAYVIATLEFGGKHIKTKIIKLK